MRGQYFSVALLVATACLLLSFSGCGHNQHLVSIGLDPAEGFVFEGPGAQGQFKAIGTYIHPPETKDITDQVVWSLDIANFGTVTQTGLVTYTRIDGCGSANISATFNDPPNLIIGTAPVKGFNDSKCQSGGSGGSGPLLTVQIMGAGSGTVVSSPSGINCANPNTCNATFASGTAVTLTETPVGSSVFSGWGNGCVGSTQTCTFTLQNDTTVTATFN